MLAADQAVHTVLDTINGSPEAQFLIMTSVAILGFALVMEAVVRKRESRKRKVFFAPPCLD